MTGWNQLKNDRKVLVSANICRTADGFVIEVREAADAPKSLRDDVGNVLRQAVDRYEKKKFSDGSDDGHDAPGAHLPSSSIGQPGNREIGDR